ncbi:hypothetical protein, partial [Salmonella sp. s58408]|uniref:hypothetical protein n=1 Tax=Salmonella sp. s58408 TaxID=3159701 RepID=UPI00397FEBD0
AHSVRCNKRDNTLATVITYTLIVKKNKKNNGTFAADRQTGKNQAQHPRERESCLHPHICSTQKK